MSVGLSVAHLLKGVAGIVQHPKRFRVYWVHLVWVLFLFLYLIHFWWWEFNLARVREWTFPLYFFVALYAVLLYLLCTLFFPEQIGEYDGFKGYYYSRRQWIFALMAALFVAGSSTRSSRAEATSTSWDSPTTSARPSFFSLVCSLFGSGVPGFMPPSPVLPSCTKSLSSLKCIERSVKPS
jgi:hypothetical protein